MVFVSFSSGNYSGDTTSSPFKRTLNIVFVQFPRKHLPLDRQTGGRVTFATVGAPIFEMENRYIFSKQPLTAILRPPVGYKYAPPTLFERIPTGLVSSFEITFYY